MASDLDPDPAVADPAVADRGVRRPVASALGAYAGVALVALAGVAVVFRPWRQNLRRALPFDLGDPPFIVWTLRWVSAALVSHPWRLFDANIFWPHRDTLAYSESLLPQSVPFGVVYKATGNAVLAHNLTLLLLFAVAVVATYALGRRVLGRADAALVGAVAFAFTGFAVSQVAHLQITTHGLVALALLALLRMLERPTWRRSVEAAAASVLLVLASLYFGAIWALCAAVIVAAVLATRRPFDRALAKAVGLFGIVTGVLVAPVALPYLSLEHGRTLEGQYSLRLGDLFAPPAGSPWQERLGPKLPVSEHVFFPGFSVLALAAVGTAAVLLPWAARRRGRGGAGGGGRLGDGALVALAALVSLVVALGPEIGPLPGPFRALHAVFPGFSSIRAVSRLAVVALLGLALLAGRGYAAIAARVPRRGRVAAAGLVVAAVVFELAAPWPPVVVPRDPAFVALHRDLATRPRGPVVVLPVARPEASVPTETLRMLASTEDWFPRFNGYSGFWPPEFTAQADTLNTLPAQPAWDLLRALRIRYLIVTDPYRAQRLVPALPAGADLRRFGTSLLVQLSGGTATPAADRARIADELGRTTVVDGSFEQGGANWFVYNNASEGSYSVRSASERDGPAHGGRRFARFRATEVSTSLATELAVQSAPGSAFHARLWARSAKGATVTVALWSLCQPAGNASIGANVGGDWTPIDVTLASTLDACPLRLEVYAAGATSGAHPLDVDIDDVSLAIEAAPGAG